MAKMTVVSETTLILDDVEIAVVYQALQFLVDQGNLTTNDPTGKALHLRDTIGSQLDPIGYN